MAAEKKGFESTGFALGLMLGVIGLWLVHTIMAAPQTARRKWAWVGFAIHAVVWTTLLVYYFTTV